MIDRTSIIASVYYTTLCLTMLKNVPTLTYFVLLAGELVRLVLLFHKNKGAGGTKCWNGGVAVVRGGRVPLAAAAASAAVVAIGALLIVVASPAWLCRVRLVHQRGRRRKGVWRGCYSMVVVVVVRVVVEDEKRRETVVSYQGLHPALCSCRAVPCPYAFVSVCSPPWPPWC